MKSLPSNRALNELDILHHIGRLKIEHFRGTFMRDNFPKKPHVNECGIVNLDSVAGPGTHWTAYCKKGSNVYYFDSFGNLRPPKEMLNYFGSQCKIFYNNLQYQKYNTPICGQLCIMFLNQFNKAHFKK